MSVTRLDITSRGPLAGGQPFGEAGAFEYVEGTLHFAADPNHKNNQVIADIALAPRNPAGKVEFSTDFLLLKPAQPRPGGRLLYDVTNRGNKTALRFNFAPMAQPPGAANLDLGDGFLMRHGFSVVFLGWQPDAPERPGLMRGEFPEALENGERIKGQSFLQFQPNKLVYEQLLSDAGHKPLPAAYPGEARAVLTERAYHDGRPRIIPRLEWEFARAVDGQPVEDVNYIYRAKGFQPGRVYELIYTTIGAPVMGLGFLAMRDTVSWLRFGGESEVNPLANSVEHAYGYGVSMSGRYVREFLYHGMNEDEQGRQVFDGLYTHVGSSRRGEFNFRFAQPSTNIARAPGNRFPFAYISQTDSITGQKGGLLEWTRSQGKMPKLIASNSGMEYWWSGASLQHTDTAGIRDIEIPEDVRTYYITGVPHGGGSLPLTDRLQDGFHTAHLANTIDYTTVQRALLLNLDRWVREGAPPPPNNVPSISKGTAVKRESLEEQITSIPGAQFPKHLPGRPQMNYGPNPNILRFPPREGADYGVLVSSMDADGNEVAGAQPIDIRVPLGTYTGWNLRHEDMGQGGEYLCTPLPGSVFPFAKTKTERAQTGDPRPSLEERYADKSDYLAKVRAAAEEMIREGFLLREDLSVVEQQASERWDAFTAQ